MLLTLRIVSASMDLTAIAPSDKPARGPSLSFSVEIDDRDHLDLETGEIFEAPRYAKIRGHQDKLINATLCVRQALSADDFKYNRLQYFEAVRGDDYGNDPFIYFDFWLHPHDFSELMRHVQGGLVPSTVQIHLEFNKSSPIQFDWEPDGSGLKWDNKSTDNRRVPIESVSFHYELLKATETGEGSAQLSELKDGLAKAQREVRTLSWIVVGATLFALLFLR
jgi:hypothetical protein